MAATTAQQNTIPPDPQPQQQQQQQQRQQATTATTNQQQQTSSTIITDETRRDVGVPGFWANGRYCIFDVRITDTDARSHGRKDPQKVIADQEKEKKDKYLKACLERRKDFTPWSTQ